MPIKLHNDYADISLSELRRLHQAGYPLLRTPHVGNQYPATLLCGVLGIPQCMVSFTQGARDKNSHPHLRIKSGVGEPLYCPSKWTPFARLGCGTTAESYHQASVRRLFPRVSVMTDHEFWRLELDLFERVMDAASRTIPNLWYRRVDETGEVHKAADPGWSHLAADVFRVSNDRSGWLVPNRAAILYDLVWMSLAAGRDQLYYLSGPDMVKYIGGAKKSLSAAYDTLRKEYSGLPEILTVSVVPVAHCRFLTHRERSDSLGEVLEVIRWYESQPPEARREAAESVRLVGRQHPEFTQCLSEATFLSQYDVATADDLLVPDWLLETPLKRIRAFFSMLST